MLQLNVATRTTSMPTVYSPLRERAYPDCERTRKTVPPKPRATPSVSAADGFRDLKKSQSKMTNQSGSMEMMSAAIDEGTVCCAHTTPPYPPRSMIPATLNAARKPRSEGRSCSLNRHQIIRMPPARKKRREPLRNGGIVSTVKRMARYVEPQMI